MSEDNLAETCLTPGRHGERGNSHNYVKVGVCVPFEAATETMGQREIMFGPMLLYITL